MPFYDNNDSDKIPPQQHRINLSPIAENVLESDRLSFSQDGKAIKDQVIRNIIIRNYYKEADASVERRLIQYGQELDDLLNPLTCLNSSDRLNVKIKLIDKRKKVLKEKANRYSKDKTTSRQLNLNRENYAYFACGEEDDEGEICAEDEHYKNLSQYLKSLIEEYARLPYVKREVIYFKPRFQTIGQAIEDKRRLKVTISNGSRYFICPYKVCTDPLATANYLVGYSKPIDHEWEKPVLASFRISALKDIKNTKKQVHLTIEQRNEIEHYIKMRGVQFLVWNEEEIRVRLTDNGHQKYNRQHNLRPSVARIEDDGSLIFNCTQSQAEFYFFKFGEDAEILSPLKLRERFAELYCRAAERY